MPLTVLAVAAHPDDELLGCGGTLARHAAAGDRVHVLILAEGATSRGASVQRADVEGLKTAARQAAEILSAAPPRFAGFPDQRMDQLSLLDIVREVEKAVAELQPAVVYTHHGGDLNRDHRIVHQAALTAARPLPGACVRAVYAFETLSSTEWASPQAHATFRPNRFVNIAAHLETKLRALDCYRSEMRAFPHPRSQDAVTALARLRGASVGMVAAEAFEVVRELA